MPSLPTEAERREREAYAERSNALSLRKRRLQGGSFEGEKVTEAEIEQKVGNQLKEIVAFFQTNELSDGDPQKIVPQQLVNAFVDRLQELHERQHELRKLSKEDTRVLAENLADFLVKVKQTIDQNKSYGGHLKTNIGTLIKA